MKNYIIRERNGNEKLHLTEMSVARLKLYKPRGCHLKNYNLLDLLVDFMQMYSWLITSWNKEISIAEFIELVKTKDYKADIYGDEILSLLYEVDTKECEPC